MEDGLLTPRSGRFTTGKGSRYPSVASARKRTTTPRPSVPYSNQYNDRVIPNSQHSKSISCSTIYSLKGNAPNIGKIPINFTNLTSGFCTCQRRRDAGRSARTLPIYTLTHSTVVLLRPTRCLTAVSTAVFRA